MAAYAALVSVMHTIEQIQLHPSPPISLDQKQVQSLTENITFLQDFLEVYPHNGSQEAYDLEGRIRDAARAAEDVIESHIVDRIHGGSTSSHGENSNDLYQNLGQVIIKDMDFIKKEVVEIKAKKEIQYDKLPTQYSMPPVGSSRASSSTSENIMVDLDGILIEIMERLTGQQSKRLIIPIVGMGGIGKTTLARTVCAKPIIKEYFVICAWATISKDYNAREILLEILLSSNKGESRESLRGMREEELGEKLYKTLSGRRYLIVMDDMWSIEVWDKLKFFFPDNNNRSRIMITTRQSNLSFHLIGSHGFRMKLLDDDKSWNLLCKYVFGEDGYPHELEEIGKKIAKKCKGLPLSIEVIGGLLAKSERTRQYWEYIAENLNPIVNLEDGARCLKILSVSYFNLPIHLKPCFLYMGVFPEDEVIHVSRLVRLWVAEGFLKPNRGKCLEEVAEDYLKCLIGRNLISVHRRVSSGKIKSCTIHDLLRDLCLREAQKEKFFRVPREQSPNMLLSINTARCIVVHDSIWSDEYYKHLFRLKLASDARSLIFKSEEDLQTHTCRLSREMEADFLQLYTAKSSKDEYFLEDIFQFVNLRFLDFAAGRYLNIKFLSSMCLFWNLQTLIIFNTDSEQLAVAPSEIWMMPHLRHVKLQRFYLPDPPSVEGDKRDFVWEEKPVLVLRNLQTLSGIRNFRCGEDVVKRIPNIKKLKVVYLKDSDEGSRRYCTDNFSRLHKLESLACTFEVNMDTKTHSYLLQNLTFPHSLRKVALEGTCLDWEEMSSKVGSLPLLQALKLNYNSCKGPQWKPVEGQFCSLKYLEILRCDDLEYWMADQTSFPHLEQLVLIGLPELKEIPSGIGDIPTLKAIRLDFCCDSAVISAKKVAEEQEELGNEDLQVQLPDPPSVEEDKPVLVLRNLQTLSGIRNFRCVNMDEKTRSYLLQNLSFPHSLRKVALMGTYLDWEEMSSKVGSLPLLQVLKLNYNSCKGTQWKPVEGQFFNLKYLQIEWCSDLVYWTADETNFPCLEQLLLIDLNKLKEVPSGIGDIPTLRSVELNHSAAISAKKLADEQEELGNLDLQVQAVTHKKTEVLESLESDNFQVLDSRLTVLTCDVLKYQ
ncbi:hypothetical protein BUALT_Bualt07G0163400 [Buddleja alternifolia]|uniref:NB-ARC domain-containing protein n=1 Tax=Buddleja alternifolia TaxID=168488 RepID=A0AAV6XC86_9LAMI|nr:hypothetical protein BUALT_Bualt07G0163400 [Buddleja alternifolia]